MPSRAVRTRSPLTDPILEFLRMVWHLEHALERASKRMEDAFGISGPQRFALKIVSVQPGITAGELARTLHLHPSTVTGIVQRLQLRRLVRRVPSSIDGRVIHLHATRAGARLAAPASKRSVEKAVRTTLARCSDDKRRAAATVLERFTTELLRI
jgi:DNA-binding MarR family transcriptional regulator